MNVLTKVKLFLIKFYSFFIKSNRSKAIFYHDLHDLNSYTPMSTHVSLFKRHIEIIRSQGYKIVEKIDNEFGQVEISFDDGFVGLYENIDVIKKLDVPIRIFIVTSFFNNSNYMSMKQVKELNKLSLVTISSHTHNHLMLNKLTSFEIINEVRESKEILEYLVEGKIDSLCFPKGIFNFQVINLVKKSGYKYLYSSLPGFYFDFFAPRVIKRSLVQHADSNEFTSILKGADHILYFWYRFKHFKS